MGLFWALLVGLVIGAAIARTVDGGRRRDR
jgi:hypothetical protein